MPVVRGVQRIRIGKWHPGHGIAILIIMVALVGSVTLFLILTLPPCRHEMTTFVKALPGRSPAFLQRIENLPILREMNLTALEAKLKQDTAQNAGMFVSSISNWATKFFEIITGIILTVYFLPKESMSTSGSFRLIPAYRRERLDETLRRASKRMGRWLLGQLALMLILGICSGIVFGAIHLSYAFACRSDGRVQYHSLLSARLSPPPLPCWLPSANPGKKFLSSSLFELVYPRSKMPFSPPDHEVAGRPGRYRRFYRPAVRRQPCRSCRSPGRCPYAVLVAVLIDEYVIQPSSSEIDASATIAPASACHALKPPSPPVASIGRMPFVCYPEVCPDLVSPKYPSQPDELNWLLRSGRHFRSAPLIFVPFSLRDYESFRHPSAIESRPGNGLNRGDSCGDRRLRERRCIRCSPMIAEPLPVAAHTWKSFAADTIATFKLRVTTLVVMTAWAGYYLGAARSGIGSFNPTLRDTLIGVALVSCGASALEPSGRATYRRADDSNPQPSAGIRQA